MKKIPSIHRILIAFVWIIVIETGPARADTPEEIIADYAKEAAASIPGFAPSAERGQAFFMKTWGKSEKMPDCTTCHTKNLKAQGKHVVTDKPIDPLSPKVNPERFTRLKKTEKWFRRNCKEVVGRECTAAEKADFIEFVLRGN